VAIDYDERAALLVVDVQNDFADPNGSLSISGAMDILPVVDAEIEHATKGGALVVFTQDWHPPTTPHFEKDGGIWPVHCVGGTWGAEFLPGLRDVEGAEFLRKGTSGEDGYSAFTVRDPESAEESPTALERILRSHGIDRVVLAGLATDYCVKETALDARRLGFAVTVLSDAIRAVDRQEGDGASAIEAMRSAGAEVVES
jgi:nicotinamidase/pyrazinamidase